MSLIGTFPQGPIGQHRPVFTEKGELNSCFLVAHPPGASARQTQRVSMFPGDVLLALVLPERVPFAASGRHADPESSMLDLARGVATIARMSFYLALFAWLLIAAVLVLGIVLATKGSLALLIISTVLFLLAFSKWGCATHE